jgi:integrase
VRQGFFTEDEFKVLRPVLPDHVKVPLIIAYWTGMRTGEVLRLQWNQLDLERGLLRLEPGTTKNNQGTGLFRDRKGSIGASSSCSRASASARQPYRTSGDGKSDWLALLSEVFHSLKDFEK